MSESDEKGKYRLRFVATSLRLRVADVVYSSGVVESRLQVGAGLEAGEKAEGKTKSEHREGRRRVRTCAAQDPTYLLLCGGAVRTQVVARRR
jgi:hypothetical protein